MPLAGRVERAAAEALRNTSPFRAAHCAFHIVLESIGT
jgi:hypothetical protein